MFSWRTGDVFTCDDFRHEGVEDSPTRSSWERSYSSSRAASMAQHSEVCVYVRFAVCVCVCVTQINRAWLVVVVMLVLCCRPLAQRGCQRLGRQVDHGFKMLLTVSCTAERRLLASNMFLV